MYDLRRSILACGLLLAFAGIFTGMGAATDRQARSPDHARSVAYWSRRAGMWRAETWHWQRVMGVRRFRPMSRRALESRPLPRLREAAAVWRTREHGAWLRAHHPPLLPDWLCIHRYEGAWNDSGAPYWGGLQMDISFQQTYGGWLLRRKGTADNWTPIEQIWVAVRAWRTRGFSPWPDTARACGV